MELENNCCCTGKKKERSQEEYKDLLNRLRRIEGQVRGVEKMVEENAYCIDILTQTQAIRGALNSFNKILLENHIKSCVTKGIQNGEEEVIQELVETMEKLMK